MARASARRRRRGNRSGASLASGRTGPGCGQRPMAQPSPVFRSDATGHRLAQRPQPGYLEVERQRR